MMNRSSKNESGFTLIEFLVVIAISAILLALLTLNLGKVQETSSVTSSADTLMNDIKSQQIMAMAGDKGSASSQQPQGLHIQSNSYVLYAGSSYNSGDTNNFTINISPYTISTTFPSSNLLFQKGDGMVSGFTAGSNTITITRYGSSKTITVDKYGALSVN
ncbi:MAG TPA: prepilin-type N-terminal cleavage/methylation domain-containing protein [Candidatus Saccharimonadales bacterium]|nr:prepilin-type N-terminal cleavage/methylation domain-containing protein [Candidatus Saccharimonadales bacterium]